MERDLDLYRDILFAVEEHANPDERPIRIQRKGDDKLYFPDADETELPESVRDADTPVLMRHVVLMTQAGLLDSNALDPSSETTSGRPFVITIQGLTHEGHDFLENIREDTVWNQTKEKTRSLALDVVKATAEVIVKESLGL
jgi:hypothetical protein